MENLNRKMMEIKPMLFYIQTDRNPMNICGFNFTKNDRFILKVEDRHSDITMQVMRTTDLCNDRESVLYYTNITSCNNIMNEIQKTFENGICFMC